MSYKVHNSTNNPVRVLLVDDSVVVRGMLRQIIEKAPGLEVVATAINGRVGVEEYKKHRPDIVVMDIEMPELNGIDALQQILAFDAAAKVIMCSSLTQSGAAMTVKALGMGAADCLAKPTANSIDRTDNFAEQLVLRLTAFKSSVKAAPASTPVSNIQPLRGAAISLKSFPTTMALNLPRVIAIGSSTGGPKALETVLQDLNAARGLPPIFITQHMPAGFTKLLAESLAKASGLNIKEAIDGQPVRENCVYVAPGGKHMLVEKQSTGMHIKLDDGPPVNFCKPAVDVTFDSILKAYQTNILSIILTGMGSDGVKSCEKLMAASDKNLLLSQNEATSIVWGMPAAVTKAGICNAVLSLSDIAPAINAILSGQTPNNLKVA